MDFKKIRQNAIADLQQYKALTTSDSQADRQKAAVIQQVLQMLTERERLVLDRFFISREKRNSRHVAELTALFQMEQSVLYRFKDETLLHFYMLMFCTMHTQQHRAG